MLPFIDSPQAKFVNVYFFILFATLDQAPKTQTLVKTEYKYFKINHTAYHCTFSPMWRFENAPNVLPTAIQFHCGIWLTCCMSRNHGDIHQWRLSQDLVLGKPACRTLTGCRRRGHHVDLLHLEKICFCMQRTCGGDCRHHESWETGVFYNRWCFHKTSVLWIFAVACYADRSLK